MMVRHKNILRKAKNIKLLASDVDGVLTGGEIIVLNNKEEIKIWNVKDGMGYGELARVSPKIETAWITGRKSLQAQKRSKEMGIDYLIQGCMNKKSAIEKILKQNNLLMSECAYLGDDIVDIPLLKAAGISACPKDACRDVKKYVDYVSDFNGGEGVVREIIELIMKAKGEWKKALDRYV